MENLVQLAQQDHLEREACLACPDFLDQKATEAFQAWTAPKEKWEALVKREKLEDLDQMDHLDR